MKMAAKLKLYAKEKSKTGVSTEEIPSPLLRTFEAIETKDLTPPVDFTIDAEEILERIARRKALFDECKRNKTRQKQELERSKEDILYWVNNWVWTHDPRFAPGITTIPFSLFKRQEEYLLWRIDRRLKNEQGIIDKSRDMGVTWLNVVGQAHPFMFEPGYKGAFGSRKEMLVDRKGDPDSIFEKLRFILRSLPRWMRPRYEDPYLKLINLDKGAVITGEAGDSIGRGGRNSAYDVDEAAYLERPQRVDAALSENCPVIFWTSTPNIWSPGNTFDRKIDRGTIPVFVFDWRDDPRKDDRWYAKKVATLDPIVVASEIDRDRDANVANNIIFAKWVRAAVEFPLGRTLEMRAGVDIADGGGDETVMVSGSFPRAQYVDTVRLHDVDPLKTADAVTELARQYGVTRLIYDPIGVGAGCGGQWKRDNTVNFDPVQFVASAKTSKGTDGEFTFYPEFDRRSNEMFENAKAEAWWTARQRFWKTYRVVTENAYYPDHELVSIPNHPDLIRQLSQPLWFKPRGQIIVESKAQMAARGLKSPDYADALIMFLWQGFDSYSPDWISKF